MGNAPNPETAIQMARMSPLHRRLIKGSNLSPAA